MLLTLLNISASCLFRFYFVMVKLNAQMVKKEQKNNRQ